MSVFHASNVTEDMVKKSAADHGTCRLFLMLRGQRPGEEDQAVERRFLFRGCLLRPYSSLLQANIFEQFFLCPLSMTTKLIELGFETMQSGVLFHKSIKMSEKQERPQPTLALTISAFKKALENAHDGAYGPVAKDKEDLIDMLKHEEWAKFETHSQRMDVDVVSGAFQLSKKTVDRIAFVWKFPFDIGVKTPNDIPLPVGSYWFNVDSAVRHHELFSRKYYDAYDTELKVQRKTNVEKLRIDRVGKYSIHILRNYESEVDVPMISSSLFVDGFEGLQKKQYEKLAKLCKELYETATLYAFPCYDEHHAVVFYGHPDGTALTPTSFVKLMEETPSVAEILQKYELEAGDIKGWSDSYTSYFQQADAMPIHSDTPPNASEPEIDTEPDATEIDTEPDATTSRKIIEILQRKCKRLKNDLDVRCNTDHVTLAQEICSFVTKND